MQIDRCRFGKRKRGLMSKVIMMCGVCGSGKTTYAKKKEQEGYIRLSIDEEMWKLYGRKGIDYPEEQYEKLSEQVEAALQKKLLSLIQQGKDVVIDFSFWSKENRNVYKELIQKAGAETELVYMKASKELLQKRLYKRNQVLNANSPFVITDEILEHHYHAFQEPCGEGEKVILQKEDIMQYSKEESKAIWNQNAEFWDCAMGDESNDFHREVVRPKVTELLNPDPTDYILDIACGNGNYSAYLAEKAVSVLAFDYSEKMVELAKKRQKAVC